MMRTRFHRSLLGPMALGVVAALRVTVRWPDLRPCEEPRRSERGDDDLRAIGVALGRLHREDVVLAEQIGATQPDRRE